MVFEALTTHRTAIGVYPKLINREKTLLRDGILWRSRLDAIFHTLTGKNLVGLPIAKFF